MLSTFAFDNIIKQFARSSSSLEGQLELLKLPTLALNDLFLFDQPHPLLPVPSSPSEPGDETKDSASSELHLPCSRKAFHDKNSLPQFSQTRQLLRRFGLVLNACMRLLLAGTLPPSLSSQSLAGSSSSMWTLS